MTVSRSNSGVVCARAPQTRASSGWVYLWVFAAAAIAQSAASQTPSVTVDQDGTVHVPAYTLPLPGS